MYKVMRIVKAFILVAAVFRFVSPVSAGDGPQLHMVYFYNPSCRLCTATTIAVGEVEEKYKDRIGSERFNVADPEHGLDYMEALFAMMDELGIPEDVSSLLTVVLGEFVEENGESVFRPRAILLEEDDIADNLDRVVAEFIASGGKGGISLGNDRPAIFFSDSALASTPPADAAGGTASAGPAQPRSDRSRARAQNRLRFGAVSFAALADSVNPCAFATIIILVAMMSSAKRTRNEIIAVCLSFTASVYLTYFAIGLFLYKVIAEISTRGGWYLVAADVVYCLAFLLCVVCGFICLRDAVLLFRGRSAEEMVMQLPKSFKKRINIAMAKGVRAHWLVSGVFVAGVTVSFLEAACTGQVYLPTIIIMAEVSFWQSMLLLAWYNLLFVLPLLVIFVLVLVGVTSQQLADFFKKNVAWTKLALGVVFALMGYWLWLKMYWPPGNRG